MDELILRRLHTAELDIADACRHDDDEHLRTFRREWRTLIEDIQAADARKQLQASTLLQAQQTARIVTVLAQYMTELEEVTRDHRAEFIAAFMERNRGPSTYSSPYASCQRFFLRHLHTPMPSHSAIGELTRRTALDEKSVLKWFRHTRRALGYPALQQQYAEGDKHLFKKMLKSVLVSHNPSISVSQEARDAILLLKERAQQLLSESGTSDPVDETSSSRSRRRKATGKKRNPSDAKISSELRHRSTSAFSSISSSYSENSIQRNRSCSATPSLTDGESCSSTPDGSFSWPCTFVDPETPSSLQESLEKIASNSVRKRKRVDEEEMNEEQEEPLSKQLKLQSPEPVFSLADSPLLEEQQSTNLEFHLPFSMDQLYDPTQCTILDEDFFLNPDPAHYQIPFNNPQPGNCSASFDWSSPPFDISLGAVEVAQDYDVVFNNFLDAPVNPTAALESFLPVSGLLDEKASDANDINVGVVGADSTLSSMDAPAIDLIMEQLMAESRQQIHGTPGAELTPVLTVSVAV